MAFRVSIRFVQQSRKLGSWTENFWLDTNDLSAAIVEGNALADVLQFVKASQVYSPYFRVSQVGVFRASEQVLRPGAGSRGATFDADYPTTKLQLQFRSSLSRTTQWFGGVPDVWIANSGNYVPAGNSTTFMNQLFAHLTEAGRVWSIRILDPNRSTFIVKAINGTTGTVTTNQNTLDNNSRVRIKGVRGMTSANGIWTITVINNTSFTLDGWTPTTDVMTKGNPTVRPQTYIFQKIVRCKVVGSTSHKVGKLPDQLSGQSKSR